MEGGGCLPVRYLRPTVHGNQTVLQAELKFSERGPGPEIPAEITTTRLQQSWLHQASPRGSPSRWEIKEASVPQFCAFRYLELRCEHLHTGCQSSLTMQTKPKCNKIKRLQSFAYNLCNRNSLFKNIAKSNTLHYDLKLSDGYSYIRQGKIMGFYLEHTSS